MVLLPKKEQTISLSFYTYFAYKSHSQPREFLLAFYRYFKFRYRIKLIYYNSIIFLK